MRCNWQQKARAARGTEYWRRQQLIEKWAREEAERARIELERKQRCRCSEPHYESKLLCFQHGDKALTQYQRETLENRIASRDFYKLFKQPLVRDWD